MSHAPRSVHSQSEAPLPSGSSRGKAPQKPLLLWVFAPHVETSDPDLASYNDFTQSHAEFQKVFAELGIEWRWQQVTMDNFREVIDAVARKSVTFSPMVLNLCDGDDTNGVPGLGVIRYLEEAGIPYTGARAHFYEITTSKITMKQAFERAGVPTPAWEVISPGEPAPNGIFKRLGRPLIVKPAVSAGSMGITVKSVVRTRKALAAQVDLLHQGYRGWKLTGGGVFVERFVQGREFTTFIIGSTDHPESRTIYPPVERVFHKALPPREQFLSFDRLWEIYEHEAPVSQDAHHWEYARVLEDLAEEIARVSWAAYVAVGGTGYGRVDLRLDRRTGELLVLEVNAQCGISEDENYTSIGAILRFAEKRFSDAVQCIVADAVKSHASGVTRRTA